MCAALTLGFMFPDSGKLGVFQVLFRVTVCVTDQHKIKKEKTWTGGSAGVLAPESYYQWNNSNNYDDHNNNKQTEIK